MPLKYDVGQKLPSISLVNERGHEVSIEGIAGGQPLILAFFRGPW